MRPRRGEANALRADFCALRLRHAAARAIGLRESGEIRGRAEAFEFTDRPEKGAAAYYYMDLAQDDGEKAVSSPVWVD